ncbi:MAG: glycosyltransferase family 4 protein [Verrucomicrobia bacterium]|nr:glycosyltransferase family 4 protein [Verrucomicrobiota bacterium]
MRVLTLCYEYPPIGGGGGRAAKAVAEALVRRGHSVRVQTVRLPGLPTSVLESGVDVYRTWGFRRRADRCTPAEMAGYVISSLVPTVSHTRSWRPDLIHAHFVVPTGVLAAAAGEFFHVPYVLTAHLGDVPGAIPDQTGHLFRLVHPASKILWQRADAVTAVSAFSADLAAKAWDRPAEIIPNGISLADRPPFPKSESEPCRMIFVGRLNSQKNLSFLVTVLAQLRNLPWHLEIVGDGPERADLESAVAQAQISDRVEFRGWLDQPDVALRQASVFLLPSSVEGLSLALLEALRTGTSIVASDIPAVRSVITNEKEGLLLPVNDQSAWIDALQKLLTNPSLRLQLRQNAWHTAERFDIEQVAAAYERLFLAASSIKH